MEWNGLNCSLAKWTVCEEVYMNSEAEEELALSTAQQYGYGPDDAFSDPINLTQLIIHQMEVCLHSPLVCLCIAVHLSHFWNCKQGYNVAPTKAWDLWMLELKLCVNQRWWISCCTQGAGGRVSAAASDKVMHVHVSRYFGNTLISTVIFLKANHWLIYYHVWGSL